MSALPDTIRGFIIEASQYRESLTQQETWEVIGAKSTDEAAAWVALNADDTKTAINFRRLSKSTDDNAGVIPTNTLTKSIVSSELVFSGFGGHAVNGIFPNAPTNNSRSIHRVRVNYVDLESENAVIWYTYQSEVIRKYLSHMPVVSGGASGDTSDIKLGSFIRRTVGAQWGRKSNNPYTDYERANSPVPGLENSPFIGPEMDKDGNVTINGADDNIFRPVLNVRAYLKEDWIKGKSAIGINKGPKTYYDLLSVSMGRGHYPSGIGPIPSGSDQSKKIIEILDNGFKSMNPDFEWKADSIEPMAAHVLIGASEPTWNSDAGKFEVVYQFAQYKRSVSQILMRNPQNVYQLVELPSVPESSIVYGLNGITNAWAGSDETSPIPGAKYPYTIQVAFANTHDFCDMSWLIYSPAMDQP